MEFDKNIEELVPVLKTRKEEIKRFLKKHFRKDIDYLIKADSRNNYRGCAGQNRELILLSSYVYELVLNSYNLKNRYINTVKMKNPFINNIETNTLGFLETILSGVLECKRQYKIREYFIDLYIPSKKLAIECDEYSHKTYDVLEENKREIYIKTKLECEFIRFDPCSEDFVFENFLNKVMKKLF